LEIELQDFRDYYDSLSDEALLAIDRDELVADAQKIFDQELGRRGLKRKELDRAELERPAAPERGVETEPGAVPEWLEGAAVAIAYTDATGRDAAGSATDARSVLEHAGIPAYIVTEKPDEDKLAGYQVMVPGNYPLQAMSVLDKEIFNPELESEFRAHFEVMSDDDLRTLNPELLTMGLLDRVERLRRIYREEIDRRGLQAGGATSPATQP